MSTADLQRENDERWERLLSRVAADFTDITLKRGFQYYKQGRVRLKKTDHPGQIAADVEGSEEYHTFIDIDRWLRNHCDCPVDGACKHMAATLMKWAEEQGRPAQALANAKAFSDRPMIRQHSTFATVVQRDRAAAERLAADAARIPELSVPEWLELFERCLASLGTQVRNTQFVKDALKLFYDLKPELPPAAERLFELNALLFLLRHVAVAQGQPPASSLSYLGYFTHMAVTDLHEAALGCLDRPLPAAGDEPLLPQRLAQTADVLRAALLRPGPTQDYSLEQYGRLLEGWLAPPLGGEAFYADELHKLEQAAADLPQQSRGAWRTAALQLRFILADDDGALALLRSEPGVPNVSPASVLKRLGALARDARWTRLLRWLTALEPQMSGRRQHELETYAGYWDALVAGQPETEPRMWEALERLLPATQTIYEDHLLAAGRYEEWMDIQLAQGNDPLAYRVTELAPLEKHAPQALLPFYHQAVERYVALKNRAAYKSAVKLLKRLAKLYKKLGREARWDEFFELFELRYSRLRALQEELRKGKLL